MNIENKFLLVCLQLIIVVLLMSVNVNGNQVMRRNSRHHNHHSPYHLNPQRNININSNDNNNHVITGQLLFPPPPKYSNSNNKHNSQLQHHHNNRRGSENYLEQSEIEEPTKLRNPAITRAYRLYNLMAKGTLVIDKDRNKVTATGSDLDDRGEIGLESLMKNDVVKTRIYGLLTNKYLCFNNKGRLVAKPKGRARGPKCEFIEEVERWGVYSKFKSAHNSGWFVGFSSKGYPLLGPNYSTSSCTDCFRFYKTPVVNPTSLLGGGGDDEGTGSNIKTPIARLTSDHFNPHDHNQRIGQIHPGLDPDFLSNFPFDPIPTVGSEKQAAQTHLLSKNPKKKTKSRKTHLSSFSLFSPTSSPTPTTTLIPTTEDEENDSLWMSSFPTEPQPTTPTTTTSSTTTIKPHRHRHRHHRKKKLSDQKPTQEQTIDPSSTFLLPQHLNLSLRNNHEY